MSHAQSLKEVLSQTKGVFAVSGGLLQGSLARAATIGLEHCPSQGKQAPFVLCLRLASVIAFTKHDSLTWH